METIPEKTVVLEALKEIWPSRFDSDLDVDQIDGFFYWGVCCTGIRQRIEDAVQKLDKGHPEWNGILQLREEKPGHSTPLTPHERKLANAYLRDMAVLSQIEIEALAEIPNFSSWICTPTPMRMRDAVFARDACHFRSSRGEELWVGRVHLGVLTKSWAGEKVELILRQRVDQSRERDPQWYESVEENTNIGIADEARVARLLFETSFHNKGEVFPYPLCDLFFLSEGDHVPGPVILKSPMVSVTVNYPLPREGVIASLYDAMVVQAYGWNEFLIGKETDGECQTAIRTWATSLLAAGGMKIRHAMIEVDKITQEESPSEGRFNANRRELVDRVPEAEPFVYSRSRSGVQNGGA